MIAGNHTFCFFFWHERFSRHSVLWRAFYLLNVDKESRKADQASSRKRMFREPEPRIVRGCATKKLDRMVATQEQSSERHTDERLCLALGSLDGMIRSDIREGHPLEQVCKY